jgi:hypothetical protein
MSVIDHVHHVAVHMLAHVMVCMIRHVVVRIAHIAHEVGVMRGEMGGVGEAVAGVQLDDVEAAGEGRAGGPLRGRRVGP